MRAAVTELMRDSAIEHAAITERVWVSESVRGIISECARAVVAERAQATAIERVQAAPEMRAP